MNAREMAGFMILVALIGFGIAYCLIKIVEGTRWVKAGIGTLEVICYDVNVN